MNLAKYHGRHFHRYKRRLENSLTLQGYKDGRSGQLFNRRWGIDSPYGMFFIVGRHDLKRTRIERLKQDLIRCHKLYVLADERDSALRRLERKKRRLGIHSLSVYTHLKKVKKQGM